MQAPWGCSVRGWVAIFAALLATFLLASPLMAQPLSADALYARILQRPDDVALNLAYGRMTEDTHDIRHAYAAYTRAYQADPNNVEALEGLNRARARLSPRVTSVTVNIGGTYTSNARQLPSSQRGATYGLVQDGVFDANVTVTDERTINDRRWRTTAVALTQLESRASELNIGYVEAYTGPIHYFNPELWLHISPGASMAWIDNKHLFTEAALKLTLNTMRDGLLQSIVAKVGWRDVNNEPFSASDGLVVDVYGRFRAKPRLLPGDLFYFSPHYRYSKPDDPANYADPSIYSRPVFIGDYHEAGMRFAYYFPVRSATVWLGAGFTYYHRWYGQNVAFDFTQKRDDDYIEPTAHVILPDFFGKNFDLRFDYRYERNFSNDPNESFENHVAGARVSRRF